MRTKPLPILIGWMFAAATLAAVGHYVGLHTIVPGPTSETALARNGGEVIASAAGIPLRDSAVVVLSHPTMTIDSDEFRDAQESLYKTVKMARSEDSPSAAIFRSVQTLNHSWLPAELFHSKDNHAVLIFAETES